jgi:hypothetical protein
MTIPPPARPALTAVEASDRAAALAVGGYTIDLDVTDPVVFQTVTAVTFRC